MKAPAVPVRYILLTYRLDQLWLPAAFWALFGLMVFFLRGHGQEFNVARSFLGFALPLIGGILAAYAVLDDPALELHFATPRPAWRMLLERLGLILAVITVAALTYQLFLVAVRVDLAPLGNLAVRQLAWLLPSLATIALGAGAALALAQSTFGAILVGVIWLLQTLMRGWFAESPWARYLFLFMGVMFPDHAAVRSSQAGLLGLAALLLVAAWLLLKNQERYL